MEGRFLSLVEINLEIQFFLFTLVPLWYGGMATLTVILVWWHIVTLTRSTNSGIFTLQCATIHDEQRNVTTFHHCMGKLEVTLEMIP